MVGVDGDVASEALLHLLILKAQHVTEVTCPIQAMIGGDEDGVVVLVAVDGGADEWQFGQKIHRILEVVLPILGLTGSALVGLEEFAVHLLLEDANGKHGHWMVFLRKVSDELHFFMQEDASVLPVQGQGFQLIVGWVSARQKQEEHHLRERLNPAWRFLRSLTKIRNRVPSERDAADGIETGAIVEHNRQSTHAKDCIIDLHLRNNSLSMQLPEIDQF